MSLTSQAYIQWQEQQLEPDYRMAPQGGMPITKGGVHLWDELKKIQDETDKWREWEVRLRSDGNATK